MHWVQCFIATLVGEAFHMYKGWRLRQFEPLSNCPILEQQNRLFLLFLFFYRCLLCAWRLLSHLPSVFLVQNHHVSFIFSPISYSSCCSTLDSAIEGQVKMLPTGFLLFQECFLIMKFMRQCLDILKCCFLHTKDPLLRRLGIQFCELMDSWQY